MYQLNSLAFGADSCNLMQPFLLWLVSEIVMSVSGWSRYQLSVSHPSDGRGCGLVEAPHHAGTDKCLM